MPLKAYSPQIGGSFAEICTYFKSQQYEKLSLPIRFIDEGNVIPVKPDILLKTSFAISATANSSSP